VQPSLAALTHAALLHGSVVAGKPREAIDMYLHNQDWPAAMRVAERCEPGAVDDIYLAQVRCLIVLQTCMLGVELWYLLPHHTSRVNLGVCQLAGVTCLRKPAVSGKLHPQDYICLSTAGCCCLECSAVAGGRELLPESQAPRCSPDDVPGGWTVAGCPEAC
jgi:hypothetical protein